MAVDDMAADTADFATAEESAGSVAFDGDDSAGPTEVDFSGTNVQELGVDERHRQDRR